MTELEARIASAGRALEPRWTDEREAAALRGLGVRQSARRRARAGLGIAVVALALALLRLWPSSRVVQLSDGSTAEMLARGSRVEEAPSAPGVVTARLEGRARFDVVRDPRRRFRVEAGEVVVEVLGTAFTVDHLGPRAKVAVERGRVRVSWPGGSVELGVGEGGVFPPGDGVAALFHAADRARAAGRPRDAVPPLQQLVDQHPRDPRAPLAAFTLGRLYLDELGAPREAAAAFARARELAPNGPLAEDARRREAEARARR